MKGKRITQTEVFEVASVIAAKGQTPTLAKVRYHLGNHGSQTTVHKYLKEWKQNCLKMAVKSDKGLHSSFALIEEKRILEQMLSQQKRQAEQYSQELIQAEKALIQLKSENRELQEESIQLQAKMKELEHLKNHFETLYQEIQAERKTLYEKEMAEKNRLIESLQEELKLVNQQALAEVRNLGYEKDDAVIQEKVKIINLQEKILQLTEESKALNSQMANEKQLHSQTHLKLKVYQKMVADQVSAEMQESYLQIVDINSLDEGVVLK